MLQVGGADLTAGHADGLVELTVVRGDALGILVADLRDERADHAADHGARGDAWRPGDGADRSAGDGASRCASRLVERMTMKARAGRKLSLVLLLLRGAHDAPLGRNSCATRKTSILGSKLTECV